MRVEAGSPASPAASPRSVPEPWTVAAARQVYSAAPAQRGLVPPFGLQWRLRWGHGRAQHLEFRPEDPTWLRFPTPTNSVKVTGLRRPALAHRPLGSVLSRGPRGGLPCPRAGFPSRALGVLSCLLDVAVTPARKGQALAASRAPDCRAPACGPTSSQVPRSAPTTVLGHRGPGAHAPVRGILGP